MVAVEETLQVRPLVEPRKIRVDARVKGYQLLGMSGASARLAVQWKVEETRNSCTLYAVLRALASFTRPKDDVRECWPALTTIAKRANGISARTVQRCLDRLYELNVLEKRRQGGGRRKGSTRTLLEGRSNRYRVSEVGYQLLAAGIPHNVPAVLKRGACGIHGQHDRVTPIQNLEWVNSTPAPSALVDAVSSPGHDQVHPQSKCAPSTTVDPGPDGPSDAAAAATPPVAGGSPVVRHRWDTPEAAERALRASGFDADEAAHARGRGEALGAAIARPRDFYRGAAHAFRRKTSARPSDAAQLAREKHARGRLARAVDQLPAGEAMARSAEVAQLVRGALRQSITIRREMATPVVVKAPVVETPTRKHSPRCQCEKCFAVVGDWLTDDGLLDA